MAIQEAMAHLDTSEHHDVDIFIFLDTYTTNSKTISECRKSLNEMASSGWLDTVLRASA